jgi:lipopolysaccharide/colanic/teichoic acid biosynthesis glycosyltransferase
MRDEQLEATLRGTDLIPALPLGVAPSGEPACPPGGHAGGAQHAGAALAERIDLALKRALDVAAAIAGLIVLAPVMLPVAAAIRCGSKGPALLRQGHIGQHGKPFTLFKFRTMSADAVTHAPRLTRIGRVLRRSAIDDVPVLLNVLNGTMSLVGPKPALPGDVARYSPHEWQRLTAKPGITGPWQIHDRTSLPSAQQIALDIAYASDRNIALDVAILRRTIRAVLRARGAPIRAEA